MSVTRICLLALLPLATLFSAAAFAQPVNDCIDQYEALKAQFEAPAADAEYECIEMHKSINMIATGSAPAACGGEDEWHLEVKSLDGDPGRCSLMIRGHGSGDCGADEIEIELERNEAAQWLNHLRKECKDLGKTRKIVKSR